MGIVPPYLSKQVEEYYERTGQTELLALQRASNENMKRISELRQQEYQDKSSRNTCWGQIAWISELAKNRISELANYIYTSISELNNYYRSKKD